MVATETEAEKCGQVCSDMCRLSGRGRDKDTERGRDSQLSGWGPVQTNANVCPCCLFLTQRLSDRDRDRKGIDRIGLSIPEAPGESF